MYKLSTECPQGTHKAGVQALCSLSDNVLVSGANDCSVAVWVRGANGREFTCKYLSLDHHTDMIRSLVSVPPCVLCPQGGFASGSLDKMVRLFSYDPVTHEVALVSTLEGHRGGVDSLAMHPLGYLLSGARDGQARVWDLATGACIQVMGDHENTTRVCGLAEGGIATGSAGRKNERGQHVDYKLRLWRMNAGSGSGSGSGSGGEGATTSHPSWTLHKTLTDHEQAIQDLDSMSGGVAFLSSSNDGTIRVRNAGDGSPIERMSTPLTKEGTPTAVYRGRLLPSMWVAGCCEDNRVRLWSMDQLPITVDELELPGTPWAVKGLENGDVVVACTHSASGRKGHVYVFTKDPTRFASGEEVAAFQADMLPPPKEEGGGGGGPNGSIKVLGPYDSRDTIVGQKAGGYGFFRLPSGAIMACGWNGSGWDDIGEVEGGEGVEEEGVGEGGEFEYSHPVEMETETEGVRKCYLKWNDGDDLTAVADRFCEQYGVNADNIDQIRNFMLNAMAQKGPSRKRQAPTSSKPISPTSNLQTLPSKVYIELSSIDWKKAWPKLLELNATLPPPASPTATPLTPAEEGGLKRMVDTLEQTSRFHASRVTSLDCAPLLTKVLSWPITHVFPGLDALRVLVTHPVGSEVVASLAASSSLLPRLLQLAAVGEESARPAVLLTGRALFNMALHSHTRALLLSDVKGVLGAASALLRFPHPSVQFTATVLLHNVSKALAEAGGGKGGGGGGGGGGGSGTPLSPKDALLALLTPIQLAATVIKEEDGKLNLLLALGNALCMDVEGGKTAIKAAVEGGVGGLVAGLGGGKCQEAANEVLGLLKLAA